MQITLDIEESGKSAIHDAVYNLFTALAAQGIYPHEIHLSKLVPPTQPAEKTFPIKQETWTEDLPADFEGLMNGYLGCLDIEEVGSQDG